jgi:hypothetical protein
MRRPRPRKKEAAPRSEREPNQRRQSGLRVKENTGTLDKKTAGHGPR